MSRKKKAEGHVNHERWLISYADFITLLFALFVVLFASSQVDKRKTIAVAQSIQSAFQQLGVFSSGKGDVELERIKLLANSNPPATTNPSMPMGGKPPNVMSGAEYLKGELSGIKTKLDKALFGEIEHHAVNITLTREGLIVSLQEIGFFDSGSAVLKPGAMPALAKIAAILSRTTQNIRVEGHTDNVPIHNSKFASNWELSTARATEVLNLLITRFGIAPQRLSAAGYAKFHPVASNKTIEGRARNRRVDIVVLRTDISMPSPDVSEAGVASTTQPPSTPAGTKSR
ncbi:MAG TPA: OmpA family protein [Terriglobia bacterium]|nr:OmpA family protein [Terriglobia bacterium]